MRLAVILAATAFWLSVFNLAVVLINGSEHDSTAIIWLTVSLFWLRFEALYATRGRQNQQLGASQ